MKETSAAQTILDTCLEACYIWRAKNILRSVLFSYLVCLHTISDGKSSHFSDNEFKGNAPNFTHDLYSFLLLYKAFHNKCMCVIIQLMKVK